MNIPFQVFLPAIVFTADAGVTFSITPEMQRHLTLIRKFDSIWLVDYPFIKFFGNGNLRIVQVFNSSDLNQATVSRFFFFNMSSQDVSPTPIDPGLIGITGAEILFAGQTYKPMFAWAFPRKGS